MPDLTDTCPPLPPRPDVDPATGITGGTTTRPDWTGLDLPSHDPIAALTHELSRHVTALQDAVRDRDHYAAMLTDIGDATSPTGERPTEALGTLVDDVTALAERCDKTEEERDQARTEIADLRTELGIVIGQANALTTNYVQARAELDTHLRKLTAGAPIPAVHVGDDALTSIDATIGLVDRARVNIRSARRALADSVVAAPAPETDAELLGDLDRADRWMTASGIPTRGADVRAWLDAMGVPVPTGIHPLMHAVRRGVIAAGDAGYWYGQQTAAAPAVDHAGGPESPAEGDRTDEAGPEAQGDAETATLWRCTDPDGDHVEIMPRDQGPGWIIVASPGGTYLTPDAAADLHAWLGHALGQPAAPEPGPILSAATARDPHATIPTEAWDHRHPDHTWWVDGAGNCLDTTCPQHHPAAPTPGPQDIPDAWLTALTRQAAADAGLDIDDLADDILTQPYDQAIRGAYRIGYASALGYQITVTPEGDAVHIGDRWPAGRSRRAHVDAECGWCADIRTRQQPVPATEEQPTHHAYHWGRSWSPTGAEAMCPCTKAGCGYVIDGSEDPDCELHTRDKTRRGGHPAARCPGRPS